MALAHERPASAGGIIFQLHRMLVVLIEETRAERVGFEQLGDVTAQLRDGSSYQEEDKSSAKESTLTDESENLWKTLFNWSETIRSGALHEVSKTRFCIVTNTTGAAEHGLVHLLAKANKSPEDVKKCLQRMDEIGRRREQRRSKTSHSQPMPASRNYVADVMALPGHIRERIVANMSVMFLADPSTPEHRDDLKHRLRITEEEQGDLIIHALGGWLQDQVLELIQSGREAWLDVSAFHRQLHEILTRLSGSCKKRRLRPKAVIPLIERDSVTPIKDQPFQLMLNEINCKETEVSRALDHYIHHKAEMFYLARTGAIVTASEIDGLPDSDSFYQQLEERWQSKYERANDHSWQDTLSASRNLLRDTLSHEANVGLRIGQIDVQELYFWAGGYHRIANEEISGVSITWIIGVTD